MVALRKFPYPYRAMLAISSDIDNSPHVNIFLEMMDYLNSSKQTAFGTGLNLEVGNSFWFYNNTHSDQLSYFKGTSTKESGLAPHCREFWQSGFIDSLHTYGNFDQGGFERKLALAARDELEKYNIHLPVWINHGTDQNTQNLGYFPGCYGGEKNHDSYHVDIIKDIGVKYIWAGKMTHVLGQDAKKTVSVLGKQFLQNSVARIKYGNKPDEIILDENKLMVPITLQDNSTLWEFQRWINAWGRQTKLDANDFTQQTAKRNIRRLILNEGFMILYTHFCENLDLKGGISKKLKSNLQFIQKKFMDGELLVATTARLLRFREVTMNLKINMVEQNGKTIILIPETLRTPICNMSLSSSDLDGLTFYTDTLEKTEIYFKDKRINIMINQKDHTGKKSISIPWSQLEYPR